MRRLLATIRWDIQLQIRNGFYYAAAFVAIILTLLLGQLSQDVLTTILPAIVFEEIFVGTFFFMAALLLLEKGEGTLEELVVTPLRRGEYLASKLVTLTLLAILETFIFVTIVYGFNFNPLFLAIGVSLLGSFYALLGFILVIRYDSINSFLLPASLITTLFSLPLLDHFDLWQSWLIYLHPMQASLILMRAAFEPVTTAQLIYGFVYSVLGVGAAYWWSHRAFYRFIILKQGVKA